MSEIDFEKSLNSEQLAAVTASDGPVLIIAAAGTGKTRTLVYRVAYLVEKAVDPRRILLLTFTNKAAREMLDRAQELVGQGVGGLWGGTFHHMANRMLRIHAEAVGYRSDYTILDQDDSSRLIKHCVAELGLKSDALPKPEVLEHVFGLAANRDEPIEKVANDHFLDTTIDPEVVVRAHDVYQERKRTINAMDFDDLLVYGLRLFREHEEALRQYQERFRYVMVDEYQDTNAIQSEWVDLIAGGHRNLLVVGDDFQSVYSWRGADFRNILSFPDRYPETQVFRLETNYRSVPEILNVANACIAGNPDQFQKTLRAVREAYRLPTVVSLHDGYQQARYVIEKVREWRREGYPLREIAVLYRSHFHCMELQIELVRAGIPFVLTSGVRFFEQAHIKDVCAVPRLFVNPDDELAFDRLLQLLDKVGRKTALKIWRALGNRANLRDPSQAARVGEMLPAAARPTWKSIQRVFESAHKDELDQAPGEIVLRFADAFYRDYAVRVFENHERRIEDIDELVRYATRFSSAEAFLSEMALMSNLDAEADPVDPRSADAIRLSTIHQAKGLEWNVVVILWLTEYQFPSGRSYEDPAAMAEERRLFYVAATRARDELTLCVPKERRGRDGNATRYTPSRFVTELDPALLHNEYGGFF